MIEKRILVAEDETASADLIREMLAASGYAVTLCEHGAAALEAYRERPFPVVVTDIEMPVMDGNELVTRLKKIDED
ncbi:MAG TPA: response regulator, partial [Spirochaetota bacterium]|nr:response regulator [Spirochaetota bacterium]